MASYTNLLNVVDMLISKLVLYIRQQEFTYQHIH